jgi:hypothetical protein
LKSIGRANAVIDGFIPSIKLFYSTAFKFKGSRRVLKLLNHYGLCIIYLIKVFNGVALELKVELMGKLSASIIRVCL